MNSTSTKAILHSVVAGIIALSTSACTLRVVSPDKDKSKETKDLKENTKIVVTKDMGATDLTDAGEQLITPYTFMLADKTFSMALEKDPAQGKALFYQAFLKRLMVFKGILTRIKPLVEKNGNINEYNQKIRNAPNSALKTFLLDGQPDIRDVYSAQTFLNQYVRSVNYFREFLIKNPELNFTINLNPYIFESNIQEEWGKSCKVLSSTGESMEVECNGQDAALRRVNSADLLVLRQLAAAEILGFSLYASYSLDGVEQIAKLEKFNEQPYSTQIRVIKSYRGLGTLRADHVMGLWSNIAQDFVGAIRWTERYQSELCPKGLESTAEQRKSFLISKGVCLPNDNATVSSREALLSTIEKALQGSIPLDSFHNDGSEFHTVFDPLVISRRPFADIKALLPDEAPKCGKKVNLPDPTLGGVFPKGDGADYVNFEACK